MLRFLCANKQPVSVIKLLHVKFKPQCKMFYYTNLCTVFYVFTTIFSQVVWKVNHIFVNLGYIHLMFVAVVIFTN